MIHKNLQLRELCELVYKNSHKELKIFNTQFSLDACRDIEKAKKTFFTCKIYEYEYDCDESCVAIGLKGKTGFLPLWLIESDKWVLRIDDAPQN